MGSNDRRQVDSGVLREIERNRQRAARERAAKESEEKAKENNGELKQ